MGGNVSPRPPAPRDACNPSGESKADPAVYLQQGWTTRNQIPSRPTQLQGTRHGLGQRRCGKPLNRSALGHHPSSRTSEKPAADCRRCSYSAAGRHRSQTCVQQKARLVLERKGVSRGRPAACAHCWQPKCAYSRLQTHMRGPGACVQPHKATQTMSHPWVILRTAQHSTTNPAYAACEASSAVGYYYDCFIKICSCLP